MTSLLDAVTGLATPSLVSDVAGRLGEPEPNVSRGLQTSLTAVLAALAGRSGDGSLMRTVSDLASGVAAEPTGASPAALLDTTRAAPAGLPGPATGLLASLFGGSTGSVADAIGRATGLGASSASAILSMAMPLVLGLLGRRARESGLDASGLAGMLGAERGALASALPAGLGALLGVSGAPAADIPRVDVPRAEPSVRPTLVPTPQASRSWLLPALLGVAAVLVVGYCATRRNPVEPPVVASAGTADTTARPAAVAAPDTAGAAGTFRETLPGGAQLNVPATGIEARLVRFVKDPAAQVNDTTWFEFDRLLFATGSATLEPQSEAQLQSVAQILQAYPTVKARIGGYTDNTGDAKANVKLSQDRAASVMNALVRLGVAADRLDARGYGAEHPVADNGTPEGRAQNRRIALRVTSK